MSRYFLESLAHHMSIRVVLLQFSHKTGTNLYRKSPHDIQQNLFLSLSICMAVV